MRIEMFSKRINRQQLPPITSEAVEQPIRPLTPVEHAGAMLQKFARAEHTPAVENELLEEIRAHARKIADSKPKELRQVTELLAAVHTRDAASPNPTNFAVRAAELIKEFSTVK